MFSIFFLLVLLFFLLKNLNILCSTERTKIVVCLVSLVTILLILFFLSIHYSEIIIIIIVVIVVAIWSELLFFKEMVNDSSDQMFAIEWNFERFIFSFRIPFLTFIALTVPCSASKSETHAFPFRSFFLSHCVRIVSSVSFPSFTCPNRKTKKN